MNVYKTLNIGYFHTNHCEDFLVSEQITSNIRLIAVMDGCTMGTESVFASMLIGKILLNISKKLFYEDFITKETKVLPAELRAIMQNLFNELKSIKNQLGLETNELLSTLIIGLVDESKMEAEFLAVGDGLIHHDGKIVEFEQDDKPDYLGYHINENFDSWFDVQDQTLSISNFSDVAICTDGIYTFKNFRNENMQKSESEIIEFLLQDESNSELDNMLEQKVRNLNEDFNHVVTDDLAIVRIIAE